jgi:hypothetical protein
MAWNNSIKLKNLYYKYCGILFCIFIILIYFFESTYAVEVYGVKVFLLCIYFVLSGIFLFGIFKSRGERQNLLASLALPVIMLPMLLKPILLIPLIGIIVLYFKFKNWRIIGSVALVLFVILYSCFGYISIIINAFSGMVEVTVIQEISSPDVRHKLLLQERDEGALGGSVSVLVHDNVEGKEFLGIVRRETDSVLHSKELYYGHWGDRPAISWVDNKTVMIDGSEFDISNGNTVLESFDIYDIKDLDKYQDVKKYLQEKHYYENLKNLIAESQTTSTISDEGKKAKPNDAAEKIKKKYGLEEPAPETSRNKITIIVKRNLDQRIVEAHFTDSTNFETNK